MKCFNITFAKRGSQIKQIMSNFYPFGVVGRDSEMSSGEKVKYDILVGKGLIKL